MFSSNLIPEVIVISANSGNMSVMSLEYTLQSLQHNAGNIADRRNIHVNFWSQLDKPYWKNKTKTEPQIKLPFSKTMITA